MAYMPLSYKKYNLRDVFSQTQQSLTLGNGQHGIPSSPVKIFSFDEKFRPIEAEIEATLRDTIRLND